MMILLICTTTHPGMVLVLWTNCVAFGHSCAIIYDLGRPRFDRLTRYQSHSHGEVLSLRGEADASIRMQEGFSIFH